MIDIEQLKKEIIELLKPLEPDKIILFGSYAYGKPTGDSDVDLFIVKDIARNQVRHFVHQARKKIRELIFKYGIGFDILSASEEFIQGRSDYFYKVDILQKGKVIYAK